MKIKIQDLRKLSKCLEKILKNYFNVNRGIIFFKTEKGAH